MPQHDARLDPQLLAAVTGGGQSLACAFDTVGGAVGGDVLGTLATRGPMRSPLKLAIRLASTLTGAEIASRHDVVCADH